MCCVVVYCILLKRVVFSCAFTGLQNRPNHVKRLPYHRALSRRWSQNWRLKEPCRRLREKAGLLWLATVAGCVAVPLGFTCKVITSAIAGDWQRETRKGRIRPYCVTLVLELQSLDMQKKGACSQWFQIFVAPNPVILDMTSSDEASFYLLV
jgi:hypothetical protein